MPLWRWARGARALNHMGMEYTDANMDQLLFERYGRAGDPGAAVAERAKIESGQRQTIKRLRARCSAPWMEKIWSNYLISLLFYTIM